MGPQVFVLDEDNKARERTIALGEVAGPWLIIKEGLEPGDRVIVGDPAGLEPGMAIDPQPFSGNAEAVVEEVEQEEAQEQAEAAQAMEAGAADGQPAEGEEGGQ